MALLVVLVLVVGAILALDWYHRRTKYRKILDKLPGPPTYPLAGNLFNVLFCNPETLFFVARSFNKRYGPIFRAWLGPIGTVHLTCPQDIELIASSSKYISKGPVYAIFHMWLGTGLLTSDGSKWHLRRKILTPAFHFNILQQFQKVFAEHTAHLVKELEKECSKPFTNLDPHIIKFTLNSICETAMGTKLSPSDKNQELYRKSIYDMGEVLVYRVIRPWLYLNPVYMLFPKYWKEKQLVKILHRFSRSLIEKRKEAINFDEKDTFNSKRQVMLDLLLRAQNEGASLNDEDIREEVDTFVFEGHDTTSAAISFSLMLIACNSEAQEKIMEELETVFGDSDRLPTFDDLQKLTYLEMCIKESLRLNPSVPLITRIINEDVDTYTGYRIPANTIVTIHIYDAHRNPEIYPNPEKFIPERFTLENSKDRHPYAYLPFSAGPRNCIGQKFAMLEMKTVLAGILRKFRLEPVDTPSSIPMIVDIILRSAKSIRVKFRPKNMTNSK